MHGFSGYFTAELYQDVFYSILPAKHTPGMHSWFPMYFPIKTPLVVSKGQEVEIQIWRNNTQSKVWYEWAMAVYEPRTRKLVQRTHVHNSNGRGYSIGL